MKTRITFILLTAYKITLYAQDDDYADRPNVQPIKGFVRVYVGINVPTPTFLFTHKKYLNCIEQESVSTQLSQEEQNKCFIFNDLHEHNINHPDKLINDCVKFKNVNNFVATYKDHDGQDKTCYPFLAINFINSLLIQSKLNTYLSRATEIKHGLYDSTSYSNELQKKIQDLKSIPNPTNSQKFNLVRLKRLAQDEKVKQILNQSPYTSLWKKLTFIPLYGGVGYTHWFSNNFGLEVDISCAYLYTKYNHTLCFANLDSNSQLTFINKNILPGVKDGHIINFHELKKTENMREFINTSSSENIGARIMRSAGFFLNGISNAINSWWSSARVPQGMPNEMQDWSKTFRSWGATAQSGSDGWALLQYVRDKHNSTTDATTNTYVKNFFNRPMPPIAFFNLRFILKQISYVFKIGFVLNLTPNNTLLRHRNILLKNRGMLLQYGRRLMSNIHQIVISPGARINITDFKVDLDISQDCYNADTTVENEKEEDKKKRYENTKGLYHNIIINPAKFTANKNLNYLVNLVQFIKDDVIPKFKILPFLEIKYRFQKTNGFTFEIGTTLFFQAFFNIDINKEEMLNYWNKNETTPDKYDKNTTTEELNNRKKDIIHKIKSFKQFCGIDLGFFASVGWSWAI